MHAMVDNNETN